MYKKYINFKKKITIKVVHLQIFFIFVDIK